MNRNVLSSHENIFTLLHLKLSDAGQYTCQVNVTSDYLSHFIVFTEGYNLRLPSKLGYLQIKSINASESSVVFLNYYN